MFEIYRVKQYNYRSPFAWKIVNSYRISLRVEKYMHEGNIFRGGLYYKKTRHKSLG